MNMRAAVVVAAVAFAGCASRVESPPQPELPVAWQDVDAAAPAYAVPARWWQSFDDAALDQLVELGLQRNLDLAAAAERIREVRAQRRAAGAALYPDIAISASRVESGGDRGDDGGANVGRGGDTWGYGLDLAWEIDVFGRLRALRRAAGAELEATTADYQAARLSLISEVAGAYLDLRLARLQLDLAEKSAAAQAATLRLTQARFNQGVADRLDVERLRSQLSITEAAIPEARARTGAARYTLAFLLASPQAAIDDIVGADISKRGGGGLSMPRADAGRAVNPVLDTPAEVLRRRPDVIAAERRLAAAGEELAAARATRFPQITLGALGGFERGASGAIWEVEAGLLQPLFDFGRISAAIDATDARRRQAALAYQASLRQALREAQTAIFGYGQALQRQQRLDTAADAATRAVELARRRYQVGTLSLLEVLDAERTLFDVQLDQAEAAVAVSQRLVTLYRTLGILPDDAAATTAASRPAEP